MPLLSFTTFFTALSLSRGARILFCVVSADRPSLSLSWITPPREHRNRARPLRALLSLRVQRGRAPGIGRAEVGE